MPLETGINSYVTLEQAGDYVTLYAAEDTAMLWSARSDTERELMLELACADIESLPFTGRKTDPGQALAFPRRPNREVPAAIKAAQVEIALISLDQQSGAAISGASQRAALRRQGVTAFSIGDLSESYGGGTTLVDRFPFMAVDKVGRLLSRWLHGGYRIC